MAAERLQRRAVEVVLVAPLAQCDERPADLHHRDVGVVASLWYRLENPARQRAPRNPECPGVWRLSGMRHLVFPRAQEAVAEIRAAVPQPNARQHAETIEPV